MNLLTLRRLKPHRLAKQDLRLIHGKGVQAVREPISLVEYMVRKGIMRLHPDDPNGPDEGPQTA